MIETTTEQDKRTSRRAIRFAPDYATMFVQRQVMEHRRIDMIGL